MQHIIHTDGRLQPRQDVRLGDSHLQRAEQPQGNFVTYPVFFIIPKHDLGVNFIRIWDSVGWLRCKESQL